MDSIKDNDDLVLTSTTSFSTASGKNTYEVTMIYSLIPNAEGMYKYCDYLYIYINGKDDGTVPNLNERDLTLSDLKHELEPIYNGTTSPLMPPPVM